MPEILQTRCVIAGGGPAGIMAGYLLARAGVPVIVLEKHADFFRDFRGDTIHPSTLQLMYELGLLEEFLKHPHQEVRELRAVINGQTVPIADFTKLPTRCKFIAFMPQWDFLNFLSAHAKQFPSFQLLMQHEVVDLMFDQQRVIGVRAKTPRGELEIRADLVIGADGRHSIVQACAGLGRQDFGVPIDVLWMQISKKQDDPQQSFGFFQQGKLLVLLDRGDYWQCGFVIPKGGFDDIKARGLQQLQNDIVSFAGFLRDRVAELDDWSKIKLLTVQINRLRDWCRDGLLCIGDSAHAMSPAGGVGHQSRDSGCRRDSQFACRQIAKRPGFGGRFAQGAGAPRMADAADSGNAGLYSSSRRHWPNFGSQRVVALCVSLAEMVSSFAAIARPFHRNRTASRAFSQPERCMRNILVHLPSGQHFCSRIH